MMPETDSGDMTVRINMPVGTALDQTDAVVRKAEDHHAAPGCRHDPLLGGHWHGVARHTPRLQGNQGSVTVKLRTDRKRSSAG